MFDTIDVVGVIAGVSYHSYPARSRCFCVFCIRLATVLNSFIVCGALFLFFEFYGVKALYSSCVVGGVLFRLWLVASKSAQEPMADSLRRASYTQIDDVVTVVNDPGYDRRRTVRYVALLESTEAARSASWATAAAAAA
eukprot:jgi/Psemu1/287393/fgenesh1_pg.189_\